MKLAPRIHSRTVALALALAIPGVAWAQPIPETTPPSGPAEVLTAPGPGSAAPSAELPPGHAPVSEEQLRRVLGEGPPLAFSQPSADVPARSVHVQLVDEADRPLPNVQVRLGSMAQGQRQQQFATTDAAGRASFSGLPAVGQIAYRVSLDHHGARTLTPPFTLAPDRGQAVFLRRLPTTTDTGTLLERIGQTIVEWKTGRARITQGMDLMNLGESTVVFGTPGILVPLPEGFTAFESEASMNDQRLVADDAGFRIQGSLPPGHVQLSWTFDVPFSGDELTLRQRMPFEKTAVYRVIVDASTGMHLDVRGFPDAEWVESDGKHLLYTEAERGPEDGPFGEIRIHLTGIPGPGPFRYVAIALALVVLGLGLSLASRRGESDAIAKQERAQHRADLLDEIATLAREKQAGEVGEQYFTRQRERIVEELAVLAKLDAEQG